MASPLKFHDFSHSGSALDTGPDEVETRIAQAYREGNEAGIKAGTEASALVHAEAQDRLRAELVEALRDHQQDRVAVQAQVLSGIAPLLQAVVGQLTPALVSAGLPQQVSAAVTEALDNRPNTKPLIRCAAEAVPGLEPALQGWQEQVDLQIDSRLTPHEVQVHWDDGFDMIDLDRLTAHVQALLDGLLPKPLTTNAEAAPRAQEG